jgi:hypothetical protein
MTEEQLERRRAYKRKWASENKELIKARHKARMASDPEYRRHRKEMLLKYYTANRDRIRTQQIAYRSKPHMRDRKIQWGRKWRRSAAGIAYMRNYRACIRERMRVYKLAWYHRKKAADPGFMAHRYKVSKKWLAAHPEKKAIYQQKGRERKFSRYYHCPGVRQRHIENMRENHQIKKQTANLFQTLLLTTTPSHEPTPNQNQPTTT